MHLKVFTLRLDPETGAFNDAEMQAFLADKAVLDVSEHMLTYAGEPVWTLLVRYSGGRPQKPERVDHRKTLAEADRALFDTLRRWRNDRAKKDGRPAYVLLTNRQVTAITRTRPTKLKPRQRPPDAGGLLQPEGDVKARRPRRRVNRGCGWSNNARNCRAANRNHDEPSRRDNNLGLRPASAIDGPDAGRSRMLRPCHRIDPALRACASVLAKDLPPALGLRAWGGHLFLEIR